MAMSKILKRMKWKWNRRNKMRGKQYPFERNVREGRKIYHFVF
jgi:hypothetical protein